MRVNHHAVCVTRICYICMLAVVYVTISIRLNYNNFRFALSIIWVNLKVNYKLYNYSITISIND